MDENFKGGQVWESPAVEHEGVHPQVNEWANKKTPLMTISISGGLLDLLLD